MLKLFLVSLVVSAMCGLVILCRPEWHSGVTCDFAQRGSHKVHKYSVPRIGGVMIVLGWSAGLVTAVAMDRLPRSTALLLLLSVAPAFIGGLAEDLTKHVGNAFRLWLTFASAALAFFLLEANLVRLDVPGVDSLLRLYLFSFAATIIAVGGVAHAINIIDGLNGLAGGVCMVALVAMGYVAYKIGDPFLVTLCVLGAGALLGFHLWNHPSGLIFCGDGGAYFLGTYIAIISVLLVQRHPQVSPWFPLLVLIYPIWETVFSAYRRRFHRRRASTAADQLHFHTLAYKRLNSLKQKQPGTNFGGSRNSDVAVFLWMLTGATTMPAVLWWDDTLLLVLSACVFVIVYLVLYRELVRFRLTRHSVTIMQASTVGRAKPTAPLVAPVRKVERRDAA